MSLLFKLRTGIVQYNVFVHEHTFYSETRTLGYNKCTSDLEVYKPKYFFVDAES